MRPILLLLISFTTHDSWGQKLVEMQLGASKDQVTSYFNALIDRSTCHKCEIKTNRLDSDNSQLILDLPVSEKQVSAVEVVASFRYVKRTNQAVCDRMEITFESRFKEDYYWDIVGRLCISTYEGWECDTGEQFDGKKVMIKCTFDNSWFDQNFGLEFSKIKFQYALESF